jgi:hypothetical protein
MHMQLVQCDSELSLPNGFYGRVMSSLIRSFVIKPPTHWQTSLNLQYFIALLNNVGHQGSFWQ